LRVDDTALAVAIGAAALAALDLLLCAWFLRWMRRVRRAQQALLAGRNVDLVEFAVGMQTRMEHVETVSARVEEALAAAHERIDACFQRRGLVRYDALRDIGGNQSTTIALLDANGTGLVISAIQGRDYARIYVKDVVAGEPGSVELTPEESVAIGRARA